MSDVDKELVEYFEYVVHEENLLYLPTNWKERWETIYTYFGKVRHTKINKKRFYFAFLHSLYWYKQNTLKLVKTLPVLKTSLLNIK